MLYEVLAETIGFPHFGGFPIQFRYSTYAMNSVTIVHTTTVARECGPPDNYDERRYGEGENPNGL